MRVFITTNSCSLASPVIYLPDSLRTAIGWDRSIWSNSQGFSYSSRPCGAAEITAGAALVPLTDELNVIVGAQDLHDWFGYWPRFHDAEIVSLHLNRRGPSSLLIHTWEMTNKVEERGFYVLEKHVLVEFVLEDILELELGGFSNQNVVFGLDLKKKDAGFVCTLDPCYGLAGTIEAEKISIRLKPSKHSDRV